MIMPLWQNPHCGTSSATHAFCTGCEPSGDRPSMVTIFSVAFTVETGRTQAARRHAIDVHGAGAALRDAAAVLGAGQPELLAQHPQQRRIGFGIEACVLCR